MSEFVKSRQEQAALPVRSISAPRVSIIIPCFNRQQLLSDTLDSVRKQTMPAWEAIVVDDSSTDNSRAIAQRYSSEDDRFVVMRRQAKRKGANVCRNEGLACARGQYVIFLDSDDMLAPSALKRRVAAMDAAPDYAFGVYQTEKFNTHIGDSGTLCNAFTDADDLHRFLSFDAVWHTAGPIWRKETIQLLGGFDEELPSFQDWDLHVRALISGINYFKVSVRDHFYRMSPQNVNAIAMRSSTDPAHLRSHEMLFERTLARLRQAKLLDQDARHCLAGLFWWLAVRFRVNVGAADANGVWRRAFDLKLISRSHYLEGLLITWMALIPGGRHLAWPLQLGWPPQYLQLYSRHFHNTPLSSLDSEIIWCRRESSSPVRNRLAPALPRKSVRMTDGDSGFHEKGQSRSKPVSE